MENYEQTRNEDSTSCWFAEVKPLEPKRTLSTPQSLSEASTQCLDGQTAVSSVHVGTLLATVPPHPVREVSHRCSRAFFSGTKLSEDTACAPILSLGSCAELNPGAEPGLVTSSNLNVR